MDADRQKVASPLFGFIADNTELISLKKIERKNTKKRGCRIGFCYTVG